MLNLLAQVLPAVVAVVAIPFLVRGMGAERFGILSIAWVVLGSSAIFDLGLGRATTKFVAGSLARGEHGCIPDVIWASLAAQVGFGAIAGLLAADAVPFLVTRLLKVSPALMPEAKLSFLILAAAVPIMLAATTLRGALESTQRFDMVNAVRVPVNILIFVLPALALTFRLGLAAMVSSLGLIWLGAVVGYLRFCQQLFPQLWHRVGVRWVVLRPLLAYGGWIQVSNILGPLMTYLDRLLIGSLVSVAAVGYYTPPFDAITRLSILPGTLTATLFPAFSAADGVGSRQRLEELCMRSMKSILLLLGPVVLIVILFAHQILQFWLGTEFAAKSTLTLQILCVGVLLNSIVVLPFSLLQALGRPDLTARFHLIEFPFYVVLLWILITRMGITGAALAWTLRVAFDAALLFAAVVWLKFISISRLAGDSIGRTTTALVALGVLSMLPRLVGASMLWQVLVLGVLLPTFAFTAWLYVLDGRERDLVTAMAGGAWTALARAK
jgi:O-antigen/teichoic acid export membrane protein